PEEDQGEFGIFPVLLGHVLLEGVGVELPLADELLFRAAAQEEPPRPDAAAQATQAQQRHGRHAADDEHRLVALLGNVAALLLPGPWRLVVALVLVSVRRARRRRAGAQRRNLHHGLAS